MKNYYCPLIFFTDCYNKSCDLLNYSSKSCPRSNHTQEFEKLLKATTDCFEKTDNTQNATCSNCTDQYVNLSDFYNSIRLKTSDKFCSSIKYQVIFQWSALFYFTLSSAVNDFL